MMKKLSRWFPVFHIIGFLLFISWSSTSANPFVEDKSFFEWDRIITLIIGYYFAHVCAFINRGSFRGYPEYRALFGPDPPPNKTRGLVAGLLLAAIVWVSTFILELLLEGSEGDLQGDVLVTRYIAYTLLIGLALFLDWRFNQFVASRQLIRI